MYVYSTFVRERKCTSKSAAACGKYTLSLSVLTLLLSAREGGKARNAIFRERALFLCPQASGSLLLLLLRFFSPESSKKVHYALSSLLLLSCKNPLLPLLAAKRSIFFLGKKAFFLWAYMYVCTLYVIWGCSSQFGCGKASCELHSVLHIL